MWELSLRESNINVFITFFKQFKLDPQFKKHFSKEFAMCQVMLVFFVIYFSLFIIPSYYEKQNANKRMNAIITINDE